MEHLVWPHGGRYSLEGALFVLDVDDGDALSNSCESGGVSLLAGGVLLDLQKNLPYALGPTAPRGSRLLLFPGSRGLWWWHGMGTDAGNIESSSPEWMQQPGRLDLWTCSGYETAPASCLQTSCNGSLLYHMIHSHVRVSGCCTKTLTH